MIDNVDDALEAQQRERELATEIARGHELRAIIDFGFQIEQFLDGEIGRRLERDAKEERRRLTESYVLLNPDLAEDAKQMRDIRHRIMVLNCWQEFFEQYIKDGRAAQEQFKAGEFTD